MQALTHLFSWLLLMLVLFETHRRSDLHARESFLHVLDNYKELMKAEEDKRALADDVRKLEADNESIRKQIAVSGMNEMQVQLVQVRVSRSFTCVFFTVLYTVLHTANDCAHLTFNNRQTRQISTGTSVQSSSSIGGESFSSCCSGRALLATATWAQLTE